MAQLRFSHSLAPNDFELLIQGKQSGFMAVYHHYADDVYSMCLHLVCDEDIASELLRLVFNHFLKQLKHFNLPQEVAPWLADCSVKVCRLYFELAEQANQQHRRSSNQHKKLSETSISNKAENEANNAANNAAINAVNLRLLKEITPSQRAMVYSHSAQNIKHKNVINKINLDVTRDMQTQALFKGKLFSRIRVWLSSVFK